MTAQNPVIMARDLHKYYPAKTLSILDRRREDVRAIDGVDLRLEVNEVVALVGESGCGKTTLALMLLGLEQPTSGGVTISGVEISSLKPREMRKLRRHIQMIFQDPYEALNPSMKIGDIVAEPLKVHRILNTRQQRAERARLVLEDAGLKPAASFANRYPRQLSGGQRQRVAIAAALVLEPQILIADEPTAMLDVSIQAEIMNLLLRQRQDRQMSILLITHNLGTVGLLADRIAVMYLGRIVEKGPTTAILHNPQHPYTQALLSISPVTNPRQRRKRTILQGETPSPIKLPTGCRFHTRCPVARSECRQIDPVLEDVQGTHKVACLVASGRIP